MQKFTKRMIAFAACLVFVLSVTLTGFAASDLVREDGFSSYEGLEIRVTTDSDTYREGEAVSYTISFKNTNDYDLDNVTVSYKVPTNLEYDNLSLKKIEKIGLIKSGEEITKTFTTEGEPHKDYLPIIIGGIVAAVVVVILVIVIIVVMKKKKGRRTTAMMLVGALLAGSLSMGLATDAKAEVTDADFSKVGVHDPSIVKDPTTGTYYIFGSHKAAAKSTDLLKWSSLSTNIASDYQELFGDIWDNYCITEENNDVSGNLWAPDVIWNETMQKWCMYMSVNGNDWHSAIVLLTADNIEGPYTYVDEVIFSGYDGSADPAVEKTRLKASKKVDYAGTETELTLTATYQPYTETLTRAEYSDIKKVLGLSEDESLPARYNSTDQSKVNCIDPAVTYDEEGNLWMTYGSWSAGIYQIKLDNETGLRDYDYTEYGDYVKDKADPYLGYKIAGGYYNSGEGPYILHAGDYYYLFLSLGNLEADGGYNMRLFRSESINGPYVDQNGNSAIYSAFDSKAGFVDISSSTTNKYNSTKGLKVMSSVKMAGKSDSHVEVAQGHNSALVDDDGKIYLVYHSRYNNTGESFDVRVHQMYINEDGWLVVSPYEYSGETLSTTGFTADKIAGTYDFVINGLEVYTSKATTANKGIYSAVSITLGADGTISGGATGTWKTTTGSNVELVIDGKTYKGVFVEQANELSTRDMTLTFTACGENTMVWGAKTSN